MKQKKYFVSYNQNNSFGHAFFDADELTKDNCTQWIINAEKSLEKSNQEISQKLIILNIQEIK